MSRIIMLCVIVVLILVSFVVHELGHVAVGLLTGLEVQGGGVTSTAMFVVFNGTNVMMRMAGGFAQAAFLAFFARRIPELWIGVIAFIAYGLAEGVGLL